MKNINKKNTIFKNIILIIAGIIIGLLIIEAILNLINYSYTPLTIKAINKTEHKSDWRSYHIFEDKSFVYDPYLIWRPKKNYTVFNSEGYRGREMNSNRGSNMYCIFAFGDSNVLGWHNGPNWPGYLDEIIQSQGRDCLVVNAGIWGYTLFQGYRRFKEALIYKPNMLFISFGANDAHRVGVPDKQYCYEMFGLKSKIHRAKSGLLLISFFDKFFKKGNTELVPRVSLREYETYLNEIIKLCRIHNIKIILFTRPFTGDSRDKLRWKYFAPEYNAVVRKIAIANNIELIDLFEYFRDKTEYFADEGHFTEEGHKVAANFIYNKIEKYLPDIDK